MSKNFSPVAIFCYERFYLLKKLLNSLKKNKYAKKTAVFFFIDYPKNENSKEHVKEVVRIVKSCNFFKKKFIIKREKNFGLKKNILNGINHVFQKHTKIIVLEDDLEVSRNFLEIMNDLLLKYKNNNKVYTLSGYSFPKKITFNSSLHESNENFFLLKRPSSWGWGTWKNKWIKLNSSKVANKNYNYDYGNDLKIMSLKKKKKNLNSWAYDWTMKHIYNNKYCMYPKHSMIINNGYDNKSTNNLFNSRKYFSVIPNYTPNNYFYLEENNTIRKLSQKNYNINPIIYFLKLIYYKYIYAKF